MSPLVGLLIVIVLVAANAFFVATEFALVSSRATRIDQLAAGGNRAARLVQQAKANPTRFISGTQLGVTVASLLLGAVGEETFAAIVQPLL
ncbi:MAG TPA: CNNM domain-containing protein, partial [Chloroflexota bacterium]